MIELIKELENASSINNTTSLITLYVPAKTQKNIIVNQINNELSSSQNIKDKNTKILVQKGLKSILSNLSLMNDKDYTNGYVFCAGDIKQYI